MAAREVPFFNYPHVFCPEEKELLEIMTGICRRGAFILQKECTEFEENLARYAGVKHALGVADGTEAIFIAFKCGGIQPGDEIIFSSHTFIATAASIHFAGAIPVPVECGSDHLMDPASIEKAITPKTRAIIPTQLNGRVCNMDAILAIAKKHNLLVFEDAAQALGSKFKGVGAGNFGVAATISFYPAKSLGCFGDGGAILTNNTEVYEQMKIMRDHGRNAQGEVVMWGVNSRLDNLNAAVLNFKLKSFDAAIARRREIAALYQELLGDVEQLVLPPAPDSDPDHFDTYQNYEIEAEDRDALKDYLKQNGVGTLIQWGGKAVHQFSALGFKVALPYTERLFTRCLMVPMNTSLSDDDVRYVAGVIKNFYAMDSRKAA